MQRATLASTGLPWLVVVAVLAALGIGVGVTGGWAPAPATRGPVIEAAVPVTLSRWEVTVLSATAVASPESASTSVSTSTSIDSPSQPHLRVVIRLTNRTDSTLEAPVRRVLRFDLPASAGQPRVTNVSGSGHTSTRIDPGATVAMAYDFVPVEAGETLALTTVSVRIYDEDESDGLLIDGWIDDRLVGQVSLAVTR